MTTPYQMIGAAVVVPAGTALAWSAVVVDSLSVTQALSGSAALTAATYSPDGFINHCAKQLRASIRAAMVALPVYFTTLPVLTDIPFKLGPQDTITPDNLNPLRIKCASTGGALHSGHSTSWQSFSLVNTNNFWCLLGLCRPGETRALTIAAGGFDNTGRFQPRWLFFLRSFFRDSGDLRRWPGHIGEVLDDGTGFNYDFGVTTYERDLVLVDQPQHLIGVPWVVGRFGSFGATRELLALQTVDETLFTGMTGSYKNTSYLATPAYIASGGWWARYDSETPTDTFKAFDVWPSSKEPVAGEPIQAWPESEALIEEVKRTGLLFRYDPIDQTGTTALLAKAYLLRTGASPRPVRRGNGNLFYSVELPLVLVPNPALGVP